MFLEIVTPEAVIFKSDVDAVTVPGVDGEFQMLNNHAPIVSLLKEGNVKIRINSEQEIELPDNLKRSDDDKNVLLFPVNSGTIELNENKIIILAD
jgi:F-type H+-transporting ATPase subunit epsilon